MLGCEDRHVAVAGDADTPGAVSYTHLDVYKRQLVGGAVLDHLARSESLNGRVIARAEAGEFSAGLNGTASETP